METTGGMRPIEERQKLLIVEDSRTHRRNLRDALAGSYELHWATNARDALALAFTKRPDLIMLDVNIEPPRARSWTGWGIRCRAGTSAAWRSAAS